MPDQTESAIIEGCKRGDAESRRALYEVHVKRTYRYAFRLTNDHQDAFDVTHDTFVQALRQIGTFQGRSSLSSWLYRITTNVALQLLRRRQLERDRTRDYARRHVPGRAAASPWDMADALAKVPALSRTMLVLRYVEGLSYCEIAQIVERPLGTIASRLNRARADLRDVLIKEK